MNIDLYYCHARSIKFILYSQVCLIKIIQGSNLTFPISNGIISFKRQI